MIQIRFIKVLYLKLDLWWHRCRACKGTGLKDSVTRCPVCGGWGRITKR